MGILDPHYRAEELQVLDQMRSHINVANAVLTHRLALGYTQEALGKAAGTKQSRVSEIEALKGNPRFDTLDRIAAVLGLMIALVPRVLLDPTDAGVFKGYPLVSSTTHRATATSNAKWAGSGLSLA